MARKDKKAKKQAQKAGLIQKKALRFIGGYALVILAFYLFYFSGFYKNYLNDPFLKFQAWFSYSILHVFENPLYLKETVISSADFSYRIIRGCDGLEGYMLFLAAILVFPVSWKYKWPGILAGTVVLFLINHIRIISLYFVGVHQPDWFQFAHHNIGFILYSTASILTLLLWVEWIRKRQHHQSQNT